MRDLSIAVLFVFLLFCIGCKKTGPQGATGATGATGAAGAVGPAGANGSVIYSGTTTPASSLGNAGDFYMDLGTSTLFGPKTSAGWGAGFPLIGNTGTAGATGATGANGKAGTQIYAGAGVPAPTLGVTGDFYMDTVAHDLYGPKPAAGWGVPIALQGPAGTANVLYTPWVTPTVWTVVAGYGGQSIVETTETIPAITAAIYNNGTVLCYGDLEDYVAQIWPASQEAMLPITLLFKYNGTETTDVWEASFLAGTSTIEMYDSQNNFNQNSFFVSRFRWVIIPGGAAIPADLQRQMQAGHGKTFAAPNINLSNATILR